MQTDSNTIEILTFLDSWLPRSQHNWLDKSIKFGYKNIISTHIGCIRTWRIHECIWSIHRITSLQSMHSLWAPSIIVDKCIQHHSILWLNWCILISGALQVDELGEMPELMEQSLECIQAFQNFCQAYSIKWAGTQSLDSCSGIRILGIILI